MSAKNIRPYCYMSVQSEVEIVKTAITQSSAVAKQAQVENVPNCSWHLPCMQGEHAHALLCNKAMHAAACASSIVAKSERHRVQAWCTRFDKLIHPLMQADWAQDNAKSTDEEMGQIEIISTRSNKAMRRCTTVAI
jgi:hypothetical protein